MLSNTAEYALQAVLYLAEYAQDRPVPVDDVAEALGMPRNYLSKILHELARAGVLVSTRGKRGGFMLAIPPDALPLLAVVRLFDRIAEGRRCLLGRPECSDQTPCAAHYRWKTLSTELAQFFHDTTVGDLLHRTGTAA